jgi:hypothetical protein
VTAQGTALGWPVFAAEDTGEPALFDERLAWCLSAAGRARAAAELPVPSLATLVGELVGEG